MLGTELKLLMLENRITKLLSNPVENAALIKKAKRKLRKLKEKE